MLLTDQVYTRNSNSKPRFRVPTRSITTKYTLTIWTIQPLIYNSAVSQYGVPNFLQIKNEKFETNSGYFAKISPSGPLLMGDLTVIAEIILDST